MSNLTLAKLLETQALIEALGVARSDTVFCGAGFAKKVKDVEPVLVMDYRRRRMFGYDVHLVPNLPRRPVLQISPDFPHVSEGFRAAWNAWALERFGTEEVCYLASSRALTSLVYQDMNRNFEREMVRVILGEKS